MSTTVNIFVPSLGGGGAEKAAALFGEYLKTNYPLVTCRLFLFDDVDVYTGSIDIGHVEILPRGLLQRVTFLRSNLDPSDVNLIYLSTAKFFSLLFLARRAQNVYAFLQNPINEALALKQQHIFIRKIRLQFLKLIYASGVKRVFAIAPGIETELNELGIHNTSLVPNPIQKIPDDLPVNRCTSDDRLRIVSAGRLHPQKNFMRLLETARHIKVDYEINIFGEGQQHQQLVDFIARENLGDRVFLRGFVDNLGLELASADLFLLTSDYEGFGNVIIEALSQGLKVISTDVPHGPRYILNDESIGLLTEKSPVKIAEVIDRAYTSGWFQQDKVKCIRRAQHFLIDNVGKKIMKELVGENNSQSNV